MTVISLYLKFKSAYLIDSPLWYRSTTESLVSLRRQGTTKFTYIRPPSLSLSVTHSVPGCNSVGKDCASRADGRLEPTWNPTTGGMEWDVRYRVLGTGEGWMRDLKEIFVEDKSRGSKRRGHE